MIRHRNDGHVLRRTADFPNTCAEAACGCPPDASHTVRVCDCPPGTCFDGTACVMR